MDKEKEVNRSDISISGNIATWTIAEQGEIAGLYTGQFKFRCFLTPSQRLAAGRSYRALLGENPTLATKYDDNLAFSLSQLQFRILEAPPFWATTLQSGGIQGDLPDENIIDAVLNAAVDAELMFKQQLTKRKAETLDKARKAAEKMLKQREEDNASESEADSDQS